MIRQSFNNDQTGLCSSYYDAIKYFLLYIIKAVCHFPHRTYFFKWKDVTVEFLNLKFSPVCFKIRVVLIKKKKRQKGLKHFLEKV